jgi:hypothetical protein
LVERTGEKCWLLACNSDPDPTLVRCGLQAKQRLAGATTRGAVWLIVNHHGIFLLSHPVCLYFHHHWDRAHARSKTVIEVMTSFPQSVCTSGRLITHD